MKGEILFRSLSYFRVFEDSNGSDVIGDCYEGTQAAMPKGGVIKTDHNTGQFITKIAEPFEFNADIPSEEVLVFCVSHTFSDELINKFRATACVEILNKGAFFDRLHRALPVGARFASGSVAYYDYHSDDHLQALITAPPEKIVLSKPRKYAYQQEYRFAFSTSGGLDEARRTLCIREFKPDRNPPTHREIRLQLGDLSHICRLHVCGKSALAAHL